ncbi:XAC2610-related protein [Asticcacaulis sp. 201]|uniref:XAC2610-related protein n=1 Tax=Asticcacaulis sp. 201 TaxID=3028787 RepID=UPI002916B149|nr:hypothetical protein [Asticcacaulis sp. 201]MDV6332674.1 hypothetical protein [Asticcacaulis sp. 201]
MNRMMFGVAFLSLAVLAGSTAAGGAHDPTDAGIAPGIYRLEASQDHPKPAPSQDTRYRKIANIYKSALPEGAGVTYAVVTAGHSETRIQFIGRAVGQTQTDAGGRICQAYAFPGWNAYSDNQPFCRSETAAEAGFQPLPNGFVFSQPDETASGRSEFIPPERKPTAQETGACAVSDVCAPEAFGYTVTYETVTHQSDRFALQASHPYTDLIYLGHEVKAGLGPNPDQRTVALPQGSFVAVLKTEADWIEGDQVTPSGQTVRIWLRREDLIDGRWVGQKAMTGAYSFDVAVEGDDDMMHAVALRVRERKTGRTVQTLFNIETEERQDDADALLQVWDANFDGQPDLSLRAQSGGAGPNSTENVFLFDPKTKRFVFDETLSQLPQLGVDPRRKTITSAERDGCCDHSSMTYRYVRGKLTTVASWRQYITADGQWLITETGRLVKGRMRHHTVRKAYAGE